MRLTQHSDFALRLLIYLATHPGRSVPVREVAQAYGISENHLDKVNQTLTAAGLIEATRGRGGGMRLKPGAGEVSVGTVVRATEPDFRLVECFDPNVNACRITPVCRLQPVLLGAFQAFLGELDKVSLAELAEPREALVALLRGENLPGTPTRDASEGLQ